MPDPSMKFSLVLLLVGAIGTSVWSQETPSVYRALEKNYDTDMFEACVRMEKQVESFTQGRLDTLVSNSFFYLAEAFNEVGETKKAISYFERARATLKSLGLTGTTDYSNSLNNLAYLYLQDGNYSQAATTGEELLANDRKLFTATAPELLESVLYVAEIYLEVDRLKQAERILINTLRYQENSSLGRGLILNKLGELYTYTGSYNRASEVLTEALDVLGEIAGDESPEYVSTAINLGVLFMSQGKYPEAEEVFEVALTHVEPSEGAYLSLLNNQALVLQSLGQLERAENTLRKIKTIDSLSVGTMHPDYAITLSNLGLVYADLKKYAAAEELLNDALKIQKTNKETRTLPYARKLNNLAKIRQRSGSPKTAVPLLEEALSIFRKTMGKASPEYATAAFNLGVALWKAGQADDGYKYLKLSASIRESVLGKNHPQYAESLLKIAEYQWEKKSIRDARQSFSGVFENYYFQISKIFPVLTEEEKSKFFYTNIRSGFDKFNSFALENQQTDPALVGDVYNYVINTKGAIMIATEKVKSSIHASGDTALIQKYEAWVTTREQIAKLFSLSQQHAQLDSLQRTANQMEKELARKSAVFENQFGARQADLREIQRVLKEGEAAVEVLRYNKHKAGGEPTNEVVYAFVVITNETAVPPTLINLPAGVDLDTKYLRFYRNNIKYNLPDDVSYIQYFQPLADHLRSLRITRVYFSPDGVYNQINLNTLRDPATKHFTIDDFDIRLVTNTRELLEQKAGPVADGSSVLIGFPKFNLDTTEIHFDPTNRTTRAANRNWRGGLLRYMQGEDAISELPGTDIEIKKISKLFGERSTIHTERDASERIAKGVNSPAVLHIATHGYFLEDITTPAEKAATYFSNPLLNAGLMLAGAENFLRTGEPVDENGDDGILTAYEAMNLKLDDTQLVVLSACETALGDVRNGEGVYGLQRAFKLAGAKSIVMSLWNVDDEATQQLMTIFYEEMLTSGHVHEAFRMAQQKVKEKYASPFYWGAFVMVGI
jgi:CHAT domain-containing protein/Tfp pilus assembly protein PilF